MSTAEKLYILQAVDSCEQVRCYTPNDEQIVHYQIVHIYYADNTAPITTVAEVHQQYSAEDNVDEKYENFVHSKSPDGQDIQHFDDTLNHLHFSDNIDVPEPDEPQEQNVQKSEPPSIPVFPDYSHLYSESETKRILSLPLMLGGKIIPRNIRERTVYELLVRNISRRKFAKNVLGRSSNIFIDKFRSSEEWDKLQRTRQEQYEKMKEWLDMSEDQKKAAMERENNFSRCRTVFTREQRDALDSHFEKFPEARKSELVGLADQLQLPWKVVSRYFIRQRVKRKNQRDQQQ